MRLGFLPINNVTIRSKLLSMYLYTGNQEDQKVGFRDGHSLNAGLKYCRMLQGEQYAIHSTCIKISSVLKTFVLSIFEWPLKTGFTVSYISARIHTCGYIGCGYQRSARKRI